MRKRRWGAKFSDSRFSNWLVEVLRYLRSAVRHPAIMESSGERILREINDFHNIHHRPLDQNLTESEDATKVYGSREKHQRGLNNKKFFRYAFSNVDFYSEYNRCAHLSIRLQNVPRTVKAGDIESELLRLLAPARHLNIDKLKLSCNKKNKNKTGVTASVSVLVPGDDDASVAILLHIVSEILNKGLLCLNASGGGVAVRAMNWPFIPTILCVEEACRIRKGTMKAAVMDLEYHVPTKVEETLEQKHEKEMEYQKMMDKALPPASSPLRDVARASKEVPAVDSPVIAVHQHLVHGGLHAAVKANDIGAVRQLIALLGSDLNLTDTYGRTALHWAAFDGRTEIFEMLVSDLRQDIDIADRVITVHFLFCCLIM